MTSEKPRVGSGISWAWPLDGVIAASHPNAVVGVLTNNHPELPLDGVIAASHPNAVVGVLTNNHPEAFASPFASALAFASTDYA